MAFPWILQADIEARLGVDGVRRAYDDNNDGVADAVPITRLLTDACSYIGGRLGPQYSVDAIALMVTVPPEVIRLSLDCAVVYAYQRHPEVFRVDWEPYHKALLRECEDIRTGKSDLGVAATPPEPADQNGGDFYLEGHGVDDDEQPTTFSHDGFGGF